MAKASGRGKRGDPRAGQAKTLIPLGVREGGVAQGAEGERGGETRAAVPRDSAAPGAHATQGGDEARCGSLTLSHDTTFLF